MKTSPYLIIHHYPPPYPPYPPPEFNFLLRFLK